MTLEENSEYENFKKLTDRVLSVPRSEIQNRLKEYERESLANAKRRGPKPKLKPSSPSSDVSSDR